jgi:hypothetical protein
MVCKTIIRGFESRSHLQFEVVRRSKQFVYPENVPPCYHQGMNDDTLSRLRFWLPYASLLITIAALGAGAPAKLAHRRASLPMPAENDFRDEPMMFPMRQDAVSWRGFSSTALRSAIALK